MWACAPRTRPKRKARPYKLTVFTTKLHEEAALGETGSRWLTGNFSTACTERASTAGNEYDDNDDDRYYPPYDSTLLATRASGEVLHDYSS